MGAVEQFRLGCSVFRVADIRSHGLGAGTKQRARAFGFSIAAVCIGWWFTRGYDEVSNGTDYELATVKIGVRRTE